MSLNHVEVLIESIRQSVDWARENPGEAIGHLEIFETYWENEEGHQFTTDENLFDKIDELVEHVYTLSQFINQNIDFNKRLPDGLPAIAIKQPTD